MPRDDWDNIDTTCGRCEYGYGVILNSHICLSMRDVSCYFSYVQYICDTVLDVNILNVLMFAEYYVTPMGEMITIAFDDYQNYICTSLQYCLISTDYSLSNIFYFQSFLSNRVYYKSETSQIIQFNRQCPGYIENCATCLIDKINGLASVYICLECKSGYYADRISGKCYVCPSQLNCYNCAQQLNITKDYWKINIRALYQIAININNNHPFIINILTSLYKLYAQSENKNDYEVICILFFLNIQFLRFSKNLTHQHNI